LHAVADRCTGTCLELPEPQRSASLLQISNLQSLFAHGSQPPGLVVEEWMNGYNTEWMNVHFVPTSAGPPGLIVEEDAAVTTTPVPTIVGTSSSPGSQPPGFKVEEDAAITTTFVPTSAGPTGLILEEDAAVTTTAVPTIVGTSSSPGSQPEFIIEPDAAAAATVVLTASPWQRGLHAVVGKDGVLMISLRRGRDRFDFTSKKLADEAWIFPTYFEGTDGKDPQTPIEQLESACPNNCSVDVSNPTSGRAIQALEDSHRRALLAAQQREDPHPWTAILEDDAVPVSWGNREEWIQAFEKAWAQIPPETRVVRLGRCVIKHWITPQLPSQFGMQTRIVADANPYPFQLTSFTGFNDTYSAGGCTTAYLVHRDFIPEMLEIFPCDCSLDCCLAGRLYNIKKNGSNEPRGMEVMLNMDMKTTADEALAEAQRVGKEDGFYGEVMQFGVLKQDWDNLPEGTTKEALQGPPSAI